MFYDVPVSTVETVLIAQAEPTQGEYEPLTCVQPEDAVRTLEVLTRQNGYLPYPVLKQTFSNPENGQSFDFPLCWFNTGTNDARTYLHRLLNEAIPPILFYERGYAVQ